MIVSTEMYPGYDTSVRVLLLPTSCVVSKVLEVSGQVKARSGNDSSIHTCYYAAVSLLLFLFFCVRLMSSLHNCGNKSRTSDRVQQYEVLDLWFYL